MRHFTLVLAGLAALALTAGSANAGTASVVDGTLSYFGNDGEANRVGMTYDASLPGYRITDDGPGVRLLGSGNCGAFEREIVCVDAGVQAIAINLRDGDDRWSGGPIPIAPAVDGGPGNDTLGGRGLIHGGAGDDSIVADASGADLRGDEGDDRLVGDDGADLIDGGPGDDLLIGNDGADQLVGGAGLDRINATIGGPDRVDCQGRDDEIILADIPVTRIGCAGAPRVSVSARRLSAAALAARGLPFAVSCSRPCAISWSLVIERRYQRAVGRARLARHALRLDADGFPNPLAGAQPFRARVTAPALQRRLRRLRGFTLELRVRAQSRSGLATTAVRQIRAR